MLDHVGVQAGGHRPPHHLVRRRVHREPDDGQARRDDVLVAHAMLGKPVTREHGGPVRLYVAPMYGYKSLKWLDRIEVVDDLDPGYWEEHGYDIDGWVGTLERP